MEPKQVKKWYWSPGEDDKLQELLLSHNPVAIESLMNRTYGSILKRMEYLGITRHNGHEWYTAIQVAEGLGIERATIIKQIEIGNLKAELFHPEKPTDHGWWKIKPKDLIEWIRQHPDILQGKKVYMLWLIDLLVGVKYDHQIEHSDSSANSGIIE